MMNATEEGWCDDGMCRHRMETEEEEKEEEEVEEEEEEDEEEEGVTTRSRCPRRDSARNTSRSARPGS